MSQPIYHKRLIRTLSYMIIFTLGTYNTQGNPLFILKLRILLLFYWVCKIKFSWIRHNETPEQTASEGHQIPIVNTMSGSFRSSEKCAL